jgi:hypothetical protein
MKQYKEGIKNCKEGIDKKYQAFKDFLGRNNNSLLVAGVTTVSFELLVAGSDNPWAYAVPVGLGGIAYAGSKVTGKCADKVGEYIESRRQNKSRY